MTKNTRTKEKILRIKEVIRFIKSVGAVSQTILKVRGSVVDESTIDHYKYSLSWGFGVLGHPATVAAGTHQ